MSRSFKAWNALKGILCIYKPPDIPLMSLAPKIEKNLLNDLNHSFLPISMKHPQRYSSHPRVIGREFYEPDDLSIKFVTDNPRADPRYSGLVLVSVNEEEEILLPQLDYRYLLDLRFGPGALEKAIRSSMFSLGKEDILRCRLKSFSSKEATLDICVLSLGVSIVRIRRYGIGPFSLEDALLEKEWKYKEIAQNIQSNQAILNRHTDAIKDIL
ncbi:TRUB2 [Lepeophtheirus salmonis]|uniref:TRUB2 n=1 Tax=Lepeophtheirus salmonis TaxID=72036 RepID=A0A7R8CS74_LEPSM|nr:TRUB2 [Lepeophtheirus salmonis]CAF2911337.1 TRUB2 [Lepeophtheirus salmonis]